MLDLLLNNQGQGLLMFFFVYTFNCCFPCKGFSEISAGTKQGRSLECLGPSSVKFIFLKIPNAWFQGFNHF